MPSVPTVYATLADIEGVFSHSDVSEQEPFTAMGRMGLVIVNPPEVTEPE